VGAVSFSGLYLILLFFKKWASFNINTYKSDISLRIFFSSLPLPFATRTNFTNPNPPPEFSFLPLIGQHWVRQIPSV